MPDGFWRVSLQRKILSRYLILASVHGVRWTQKSGGQNWKKSQINNYNNQINPYFLQNLGGGRPLTPWQRTPCLGMSLVDSSQTFAANAGGQIPPWATKIYFSHFTLIRVQCDELFCKTNINSLKVCISKRYLVFFTITIFYEPGVWHFKQNYFYQLIMDSNKFSGLINAVLDPNDAIRKAAEVC